MKQKEDSQVEGSGFGEAVLKYTLFELLESIEFQFSSDSSYYLNGCMFNRKTPENNRIPNSYTYDRLISILEKIRDENKPCNKYKYNGKESSSEYRMDKRIKQIEHIKFGCDI